MRGDLVEQIIRHFVAIEANVRVHFRTSLEPKQTLVKLESANRRLFGAKSRFF
jgi:predicted RNA-binding protein YlqC (UPF0109 family)